MNLTFVNKLPRIHYNQTAGAVSLALLLSLGGLPSYGEDTANGKIHHVLLISLDGMHSLDMANYIKGHPQSALAQLAATGVNYTAASTTKPSDSFPAMVGIVTGGTPAVKPGEETEVDRLAYLVKSPEVKAGLKHFDAANEAFQKKDF
jgi:hypothetical protein